MGIWKNGSGYVAEFTHKGTRYRSSTVSDQNQAEVWLLKTKAAVKEGLPPPTTTPKGAHTSPTLSQALDEAYTQHWQDGKRGEETYHLGELVVSALSDPILTSIDQKVVEGLVAELRSTGQANGTINRKLSTLSVMLKVAEEKGWVTSPPKIPRLREAKGRVSVFSKAQEKAILSYFAGYDQDAHDITVCLFDCGARKANVLGIRWDENVVEDKLRFYPDGTKGENHIVVPMTPRVKGIMDHRAGKGEGPFLHVTPTQFRYRWDKMREALGRTNDPEFIPHTCRHTFITRLLEGGVGELTVQRLAGHQDLSTTQRYTHFSSPHLESAIAVLGNDGYTSGSMGDYGKSKTDMGKHPQKHRHS